MKVGIYSMLFIMMLVPLWSVHAAGVSGGELYMTPESELRTIGEPFEVQVYANTGGQAVNAIEGELAYDPSIFSIEKISTDNSILTSWSTQPSYNGATGTVTFSGWAGQIFTGTDGLLVTITLVPLRVGQSSLDFNSGAMLAADAKGSNIITSMRSSVFRVQPVQIQVPNPQPAADTSSTTPDVAPTSVPAQSTPPTATQSSTLQPGQSNAAALALSGVELAPLLIPFVALLALIAFAIAYVLHRFSR